MTTRPLTSPPSISFVAILLLVMLSSASPVFAADIGAAPTQTCISVYRYGGAGSGWIVDGNGNFPTGTFKSITRHVGLAQSVFTKVWMDANQNTYSANVRWIWNGIIEDLADPYGARNGDIRIDQGQPTEGMDRPIQLSDGSTSIVSPDIDLILKYVADSQCYPVVFVNGLPGAYGLTIVNNNQAVSNTNFRNYTGVLPAVPTLPGVVTLIDSKSFPRTEDPQTTRQESMISTLGHELGHAACLDPVVMATPRFPIWGDATGHPPKDQKKTPTPEGKSKAGDGRTLYLDVMWYTGFDRTGDEFMTLRQTFLSNMCVENVNGVREVYAPSFTVEPGGQSGLFTYLIYGGPATPLNDSRPPVRIGLGAQSSIDGFSYDLRQFPNGRYPYKFTVSQFGVGRVGSALNDLFGFGINPAGFEFSSPADPAGSVVNTNMLVLGPLQFGIAPMDNIAALTFKPPSFIDPLGFAFINPGKRVFFSVPPNDPSGFEPGEVALVEGNANGPIFSIYATRDDLGLKKDDDIDGLCVRDNGNGTYEGPPLDIVLFSLDIHSPSVNDGSYNPGDILIGQQLIAPNTPLGPPLVVRTAKSLGLLVSDDLKGLKCFAVLACDINQDGKVNKNDIQLIVDARNQKTFIGDPRDVDGDGIITANDARICTQRCNKPNCAE